ncbi:cysteine hydrolase family protein [Mycobacterium sp. NAZ190054]|uniref:cysteine hydrolase family protein n=1 Tax=Mycobacterium sp. NAZ190054 TaxID=1747766 RepID=UPI0012E381C2|nr:isochorismatase family cysteine hydrolase [Mycobacterium sp. NAZ190054]
MPEFRLDPGRAALVVIDMQRLDAHRDGEFGRRADVHGVRGHVEWFFDRLEHLTVPAIAALLAAAREAGMPVVHTRIASLTGDGRDLGWRYRYWDMTAGVDEPDSEFLPEVAPVPGDIVINKTTTSAFIGSHIDRILRNLGVEQLVVCGVMTSGCVESTVRDAADSGYHVLVAEEACAALTETAHVNSINAMHPVFATVEPLAAALARFTRPPADP